MDRRCGKTPAFAAVPVAGAASRAVDTRPAPAWGAARSSGVGARPRHDEGGSLLVVLDADLRLRSYTPDGRDMLRLTGRDRGRSIAGLCRRLAIPDVPALCKKAVETGRPQTADVACGSGSPPVRLKAEPLVGAAEAPGGGDACALSRLAIGQSPAETSDLVVREQRHRMANMFSIVEALVARARREAEEDRDGFGKLESRVRALSHTHRLLTESTSRDADFHALVTQELGDVYGHDRFTVAGPALFLNARAGLALGLLLHELASNAARHGALAADRGSVEFSWFRERADDAAWIVFHWKERGGSGPRNPTRRGFGSQLIETTVNGLLNGSFHREYRSDGLSFVMRIPRRALSDATCGLDARA